MQVFERDETGHIDVVHSDESFLTCGTLADEKWSGRMWGWDRQNGPKLLKHGIFTSKGEFLCWAKSNEKLIMSFQKGRKA